MCHKDRLAGLFLFSVMTVLGCNPSTFVQPHSIAATSDHAAPRGPRRMIHPMATLDMRNPVYALAVSPSDSVVAIGSGKKILLWSGIPGEAPRVIDSGMTDIISLAFTPDGKTLASGSYQKIDLWDVATGTLLGTLQRPEGYVTALAFTHDGSELASGLRGIAPAIHLWALATSAVHTNLAVESSYSGVIQSIAFHPSDKTRLASVGPDRKVRLWSVSQRSRSGAIHPWTTLIDPGTTPSVVSFHPEGYALAVGTVEGPLLVYDNPYSDHSGKARRLIGHRAAILSLAFSSDGARMISIGQDGTVRHWETQTGKLVDTQDMIAPVHLAAIMPRGKNLVTAGSTGIGLFATAGTPPMITIRTPSDLQTAAQPDMLVTGEVVDDACVESVSIAVNGVRQVELPGSRNLSVKMDPTANVYPVNQTVALQEGQNTIAVTALDCDGLQTTKTVQVTYAIPPVGEEVWAVVIGISAYKTRAVGDLKYAHNDAKAIYKYLVTDNHIPPQNVTLLLNEEATLDAIKTRLGELKNQAGREDTVLIYYAGHGTLDWVRASADRDGFEKYLLLYDSDPRNLYATALPMSEIARIFYLLAAERVILIQDTCYSGSSDIYDKTNVAGVRTPPTIGMRGGSVSISEGFLNRIAQGKGRVIIASSEANQPSMESEDLKHGVFTHYFLEAFRYADSDGDGMITTNEAFQYVSNKVPSATDQKQHPVKKGEETGRIILGKVRAKS